MVTANCSALPDVVGDAAVLVEPDKTESIRQGILAVLEKEELRKQMIERGIQQAKKFSWKKTADSLVEICQRL